MFPESGYCCGKHGSVACLLHCVTCRYPPSCGEVLVSILAVVGGSVGVKQPTSINSWNKDVGGGFIFALNDDFT